MKKQIALALLPLLTFSAFTLSGCKEQKCEHIDTTFTQELKLAPTFSQNGVVVKKCDGCESVIYEEIPMLSDYNKYDITYILPSLNEEGEVLNGSVVYTHSTYGSFNVDHEFLNQRYVLEADFTQRLEGAIFAEERTSSYFEFYSDRTATFNTLNESKEVAIFYSYQINDNGSYTFKIDEENNYTFFLFSDGTYSTKLEDNKALISNLNNEATNFTYAGGFSGGYEVSDITISIENGTYGELTKRTTRKTTSSQGTLYYQFFEDGTIAIIESEKPFDKTVVKSVKYANVNYRGYSLTLSDAPNSIIKSLQNAYHYLIDTENTSYPKPSTLGYNAQIKANEDSETFILTYDNQQITLSKEDLVFEQKMVYSSEQDTFVLDTFAVVYCNDENTPFAALIQVR